MTDGIRRDIELEVRDSGNRDQIEFRLFWPANKPFLRGDYEEVSFAMSVSVADRIRKDLARLIRDATDQAPPSRQG